MMARSSVLFFIVHCELCIVNFPLHSQNLTAFTDYRDRLICFDMGAMRQLEFQPVKSFKAGNNFLLYHDNTAELKLYTYTGTNNIAQGEEINYAVSDYMAVFTLTNRLYVIENGNYKTLSAWAGNYTLGDSIIVFYDDLRKSFSTRFAGKTYELDTSPYASTLTNYSAGDNLVAYVDRNGYLIVFYRGENIELDPGSFTHRYKAGRNVVAYFDNTYQKFRCFISGKIFDLETFEPKNFQAGDDLIAYTDHEGNFKVMYDKKVSRLITFEPDFFIIRDSILLYSENNLFKLYFKGQAHTLEENFVPKDYRVDNSTAAWIDQQGRLKTFWQGKVKILSYEPVKSFSVTGNTIHYVLPPADNHVFWEGQVYQR